jgi:hypothetical protein
VKTVADYLGNISDGLGGGVPFAVALITGIAKSNNSRAVQYVGRRVSDQSALVSGTSKKTIYYPGEETLRPVLMNAFAGGVKLLHWPPDPAAIFHDGNLVTRDPLAGKVGDVLDVVEKGNRIVVGAQQTICLRASRTVPGGISGRERKPMAGGTSNIQPARPKTQSGRHGGSHQNLDMSSGTRRVSRCRDPI